MKTDIYTSWENHVIGGCALNHGLKNVRVHGKGLCAKVWDVCARWLCMVRDTQIWWYFTSICFISEWLTGFWVSRSAAWLSMYRTVESGMLWWSSKRNWWRQMSSLEASIMAMYSVWVSKVAAVCNDQFPHSQNGSQTTWTWAQPTGWPLSHPCLDGSGGLFGDIAIDIQTKEQTKRNKWTIYIRTSHMTGGCVMVCDSRCILSSLFGLSAVMYIQQSLS